MEIIKMNITNGQASHYTAYNKTTINKTVNTTAEQNQPNDFEQTMKTTSNPTSTQPPSAEEAKKHFILQENAPANITVGTFRVSTEEDINRPVEQKGFASRFEHAVFNVNRFQSFDDYLEMTKDPQKVMDQSREGYYKFKRLAKETLAQLNEIDSTNSYNIHFSNGQSLVVTLKDGLKKNPVNIADYEKIQSWIAGNSTELNESAKAYADYALSKSIKDYEEATGINRQVLEDRSSIPIEGMEGGFKASTAEMDEYLMKMMQYANNAFSSTPKSYAEIDSWGHPGYPTNSTEKPDGLLPNMT